MAKDQSQTSRLSETPGDVLRERDSLQAAHVARNHLFLLLQIYVAGSTFSTEFAVAKGDAALPAETPLVPEMAKGTPG